MTANSSPEKYTMPRDGTESNRLNAQHEVWKANCDFLLHPRIKSSLSEHACIAEVGTGTGVWLQDLASQSPLGWNFTGLDISEAQFPKQRDGKITYALLNILEDIPEQYRSQFDVVHLRLLVGGFTTPDWQIACNNLIKLLKPNGWVLWEEGDWANSLGVNTNIPGSSIESCHRYKDLFFSSLFPLNRFSPDAVSGLPERLKKAGFVDVHTDIIASDRVAETRRTGTEVLQEAFGSLLKILAAQGLLGNGYGFKEMEQLGRECSEELKDDKAYWRWNIHAVIARKPTS